MYIKDNYYGQTLSSGNMALMRRKIIFELKKIIET